MDSFYEALNALERAPAWAWATAGAALSLVLSFMAGRIRSRTAARPAPVSPARVVASGREAQKNIARLEAENAALSNFYLLLPDFTKGINSRMERRAIAPLLVTIIDRLFSPTQILIFFTDDKNRKLILVQQKGLAKGTDLGFQVGIGEGRIGWVARHRVTMDVDDFIREMRHSGVGLEGPAHFQFKTELCAPMMHEEEVSGVISVGGITRHYKYEKSMLTLLADLGSIALHNNALFSKIQEMANCDGLTGLYNKRYFMNRLSEEILRAEQGHYPVSLFLFDLDNFKHYNDTQGHQAGDEVLKMTGDVVRETVRPDDIAARYGGEEFVVVLPHSSKEGAMNASERLRSAVEAHPYPHRESQPMKCVSLSGGVATFPDDGRTGNDLIAAADAALYRAKKAGRNRVCRSEPKYFSDETDEGLSRANSG